MRCIVHIRKSLDYPGMHFVLRLLPVNPLAENGRRVETFTSEGTLLRRLIGMGLPQIYMGRSFANLREGLDAAWNDVEIAQETFDRFGKVADMADRQAVAA
jgi:hypothetical protein